MIDTEKLCERMESSFDDAVDRAIALFIKNKELKAKQSKEITKDDGGASSTSSAGFTQSTSATSGITAYGNTGKKRIKLKSRRAK